MALTLKETNVAIRALKNYGRILAKHNIKSHKPGSMRWWVVGTPEDYAVSPVIAIAKRRGATFDPIKWGYAGDYTAHIDGIWNDERGAYEDLDDAAGFTIHAKCVYETVDRLEKYKKKLRGK